ncbi:MAG: GNAT family N-acetyltransferase [Sphingomonas sp.]|nr:GNAT family N-acetyltransferase [Sphingomonas sp.]
MHAAYRRGIFAGLMLADEPLCALIAQQHRLFEHHIARHFPDADRWIILHGGTPIGRLCVDRTIAPWRVIDIGLIADHQCRKVGSTVLTALGKAAADIGAAIDLHVGIDNRRAEALYRRLGFVNGSDGAATHRHLIWHPDTRSAV